MGYTEDIERSRTERDRFLAEHYASPLSEEDQAAFDGLDHYPPDPRWRIAARFERQDSERVAVPSSNGGSDPYARLGRVMVTVAGSEYSLDVFDDGDGNAFIPFADATNGTETYGGGRYVDVVMADDGAATIDFNHARNPYCAYDDEFVCPLPPESNRIAAPVEAGERSFRHH